MGTPFLKVERRDLSESLEHVDLYSYLVFTMSLSAMGIPLMLNFHEEVSDALFYYKDRVLSAIHWIQNSSPAAAMLFFLASLLLPVGMILLPLRAYLTVLEKRLPAWLLRRQASLYVELAIPSTDRVPQMVMTTAADEAQNWLAWVRRVGEAPFFGWTPALGYSGHSFFGCCCILWGAN